jgi:hypothetical protein
LQSLSFHKSKSGSTTALPSQLTLANKIGTTEQGSATSGLASALNQYTPTYGGFTYVASDLTDQSNARVSYISRISNDIVNQTNAPIVLLDTAYLPRYAGSSIRHYNTIGGYNYNNYTTNIIEEVRMYDPHYSNTYYGVYWDTVGDLNINGAFRSTYYADAAGNNKAMAW